MSQRLSLVLSGVALVVAVLALSGLGEAALNATPIPRFAQNAGAVNGIQASRTPQANKLLALSTAKKFPLSVLPRGTRGPRGLKGPAGPPGPIGPQGPTGQ